MIKLDINGYSGNFVNLNGNNIDFNFNRLDVARAVITIGFRKYLPAIQHIGKFRFLEILNKTFAYLDFQNGNFFLNNLYRSLDASEKRVISYFYGQGFTKLYAERSLNCDFVDHISNHKTNIAFHTLNTISTPKIILDPKLKYEGLLEPDLLGIDRNNNFHILEAKGSSSGFKLDVLQKAINQVSIINNVNGLQPITRTACFFDMSNIPIRGTIQDPPGSKLIDIQMNIEMFKIDYYSPILYYILFNEERTYRFTIDKVEFILVRIPNEAFENLYIGLHFHIFEDIIYKKEKVKIIDFEGVTFKSEEILEYSLGPDGILFISFTKPLIRT